jgi:hypothetical protein
VRIYGKKVIFPRKKMLFFTGKVERINVTFEISKVLQIFRCYILKVVLVGAKSSYEKKENVPYFPKHVFICIICCYPKERKVMHGCREW